MADETFIPTDALCDDLAALCVHGSVSGDREALAATAATVADLLRRRRFDTVVVPTTGAPVVIGRRAGRSPFTLLLYHHYDVAPPGPWRVWHHEPFQLAEREGRLFGRGVADGKGPLAAHLAALDALLTLGGDLPYGIVVLAEGEALSGSPSLGAVVADHLALLRADLCLASGGERDLAGVPLCYGGAKGLLQLRLTAVGANQPLPPGAAALAPNPLWRLTWALGQIKSDQEEILVEGFYQDVEGPSRAENQLIRTVPLDEAGRLAAWGLSEFMFGMSGPALTRTEATLPTCNLSSLTVDPPSDGSAIPVAASARVDFQLVPRQRPQAMADLVRAHLKSKGLADISLERLPGGYPAAHTPIEHPLVQKVRAAAEQLYGIAPHWMALGPFSRPLFFFTEALGIPAIALGCARVDSATYGPNEQLPLADLVEHARLLLEIAHTLVEPTARTA